MFARFTDAARQVIVDAQEEAKKRGDNHIGSEHLVLGLIVAEEEEAALRALTALGINAQMFRKVLTDSPDERVESVEKCEVPKFSSQERPFTPRAKRILELSLREALSLGHNYIGVEHILLGLVRENEGTGVGALEELGVDLSEVRDQVIESFQPGSIRADPLEALKQHLQRAKEQIPLIKGQVFKDNALKDRWVRGISEAIQEIEFGLDVLSKIKK